MSGYILCQTPRAKNPYYIENISTNIYSIEELCYYLYHNLYLIDGTIISEGLCAWLENELKLTKLAAKIRPAIGKFANIEDIIYPVIKEINYLPYDELKKLGADIQRYNSEHPAVREKQKGDSLVENGMYVHAIRVYQELLKRTDLEEAREGLTESIYHNLGCACSYLFQMEKALECFRQAYEISLSDAALETYLTAFHSIRTPIEYQSLAAQLNASPEVLERVKNKLAAFARKPEPAVYSQHIDGLLRDFTAEYHRSTGS